MRYLKSAIMMYALLAFVVWPYKAAMAQENQPVSDDTILTGNMEPKDIAVLQSLDKITARTHKFEVPVGETVRFGTIYILVQACKKAPPIEQPESAAFLQVWQKKTAPEAGDDYQAADVNKPRSEWVFSGWMFASSPALSSMDHPVYDVWVLDCKNEETTESQSGEDTQKEQSE